MSEKFNISIGDNKFIVNVEDVTAFTSSNPTISSPSFWQKLTAPDSIHDIKIFFDAMRNTGLCVAVLIFGWYGLPETNDSIIMRILTIIKWGVIVISAVLFLFNILWLTYSSKDKRLKSAFFIISLMLIFGSFAYSIIAIKDKVITQQNVEQKTKSEIVTCLPS